MSTGSFIVRTLPYDPVNINNKLFLKKSSLCTWSRYLNVTDRRTYGQTTYNLKTAHRAVKKQNRNLT